MHFKIVRPAPESSNNETLLSLVIPTSPLQINTPQGKSSATLNLQMEFSLATELNFKRAYIQLVDLKIHPMDPLTIPFKIPSLTAWIEPHSDQLIAVKGSIQLEDNTKEISVETALPINLEAFFGYLLKLKH